MDPVDRYFHEQRAVIDRCEADTELLDLMADYRDELRLATTRGQTRARLRLHDLLELAERRAVRLKTRALRARVATRADPDTERAGVPEVQTPASRWVAQRETSTALAASVVPSAPPTPSPEEDERLERLRAKLAEEREARQRAEEAHQAAIRQAEAQRRAAEEQAEAQRQEAQRIVRESRRARERAEEERQAAEEMAELRRQKAERRAEQCREALERAEQARQEAEQRAAALEEERATLRRLRAELEEARAARELAEDERLVAEEREQQADQDRLAAEERERRAEQDRLAAEERANALERAELERELEELRRSQEQRSAERAAQQPMLPPPMPTHQSPASPSPAKAHPRPKQPGPAAHRLAPAAKAHSEATDEVPAGAEREEPTALDQPVLTGADLVRFCSGWRRARWPEPSANPRRPSDPRSRWRCAPRCTGAHHERASLLHQWSGRESRERFLRDAPAPVVRKHPFVPPLSTGGPRVRAFCQRDRPRRPDGAARRAVP